MITVLPRYVTGPLGAGDFEVGLVTGAFAFSAIVLRPFAGRAADRRGRRVVVVVGAALVALGGIPYFFPELGVPGLIAGRLLLGAGEGLVFTAGVTWSVDLSPPERRGRVIGLFGLSIWMGLAIGPPIGELLRDVGGYDAVWALATATPVLGALLAARLGEAGLPGEPQDRRTLLPRPALRPGLALFLAALGFAALASFVVLHLDERDAGSGAGVFTAFAATAVAARLLGGELPDRIGGARSATLAGCAEAVGLALIAGATAWWTALLGGMVMGLGFSLLFPSLALLVVNAVEEKERGAAMGTFTAFFDAGIGVGGPLVGAIATVGGYGAPFWTTAAFAAAGVLVAGTGWRAARVAAPAEARG